MKKEIIAITGFKKKPYAAPQISVVEIKEADIICTSTGDGQLQSLDDSDEYIILF